MGRAASPVGEPLPGLVRGRFECSLGPELSDIRVHAGAESAEAANAVGQERLARQGDDKTLLVRRPPNGIRSGLV